MCWSFLTDRACEREKTEKNISNKASGYSLARQICIDINQQFRERSLYLESKNMENLCKAQSPEIDVCRRVHLGSRAIGGDNNDDWEVNSNV